MQTDGGKLEFLHAVGFNSTNLSETNPSFNSGWFYFAKLNSLARKSAALPGEQGWCAKIRRSKQDIGI